MPKRDKLVAEAESDVDDIGTPYVMRATNAYRTQNNTVGATVNHHLAIGLA
jgi:hypothetical protein